MTVNVELLDRAVAFARESAERPGEGVPVQVDGNGEVIMAWVQRIWSVARLPEEQRGRMELGDVAMEKEYVPECGTGCCLAGWVAHATGAKVLFFDNIAYLTASQVRTPAGEVKPVREYAMKTLGLSDDQASALFSSDNSLRTIELLAEQIKAGMDGLTLWNFYERLQDEDAALEALAMCDRP